MTCAFCESKDILKREIWRNNLVWAFPTNIPITPGHILICPVRCVKTIDSMNSAELAAMFRLLETMKPVLAKEFQADGFNFAWNEGATAGQTVPHLHLHIVPRREGDAGIYHYEPRSFLYRPGSRAPSPEAELEEIAASLRHRLAQRS